MPSAVTVWAVDLGVGVSSNERKGVLLLDEGHLRFAPWKDEAPEVAIPLVEVRRVKRLRGSPVLLVERSVGPHIARIAFYFVQPPPLETPKSDLPPWPARQGVMGTLTFRSKRRVRRQNAGYLGMSNKEKKAEIVAWEVAVHEAIEAARGAGRAEG
jgi:hypothetical protein